MKKTVCPSQQEMEIFARMLRHIVNCLANRGIYSHTWGRIVPRHMMQAELNVAVNRDWELFCEETDQPAFVTWHITASLLRKNIYTTTAQECPKPGTYTHSRQPTLHSKFLQGQSGTMYNMELHSHRVPLNS